MTTSSATGTVRPRRLPRLPLLPSLVLVVALLTAVTTSGLPVLPALRTALGLPDWSVSAAPARLTAVAGGTASTTVTVSAVRGWNGTVDLSTSRGPSGTASSFSPGTVRLTRTRTAATSVLTLSVPGTTKAGTYRVRVVGRHKASVRWTTLTLVVTSGGLPFTAAGPTTSTALVPGGTAALDVRVTNPNTTPITLTGLTVRVTATSDEAGCPAAVHFRTADAAAPVTVPAGATRTLSDLGVPSTDWPQVSMLDLPSNQDACKSLSLTLAFTGTATGGTP